MLEVETDKSILEVESTVTGTLQTIVVAAGAEATTGQILASFAVEHEQAAEVTTAFAPRNVVLDNPPKPDMNPQRPRERDTDDATQTHDAGKTSGRARSLRGTARIELMPRDRRIRLSTRASS